MADTKLLLLLVGGLTLSTLLVGVVLLSYNSWNQDSNGDGLPDGQDFYQERCPEGSYFCNGMVRNITTCVNYTTYSDENAGYIHIKRGGLGGGLIPFINTAPYWRFKTGIGWISEAGDYGLTPPSAFLLYDNIQPLNGRYQTTYYINNTVNKPFGIVIRWVDWNEVMYVAISSKQICVNGAKITTETPQYCYNSGNYDIFSYDTMTIYTDYNPNTNNLKFNITETGIGFDITAIPETPLIPNILTIPYYGGVGTKDTGINLYAICTYIFESKAPSMWDTLTNFFDMIWGLVSFNPDQLCTINNNGTVDCIPWWIIVLFIYVPGLIVLAILVDMFMPNWL